MENIGVLLAASSATAVAIFLFSESIATHWETVSTRCVADLLEDCRKISFNLNRVKFFLQLWGAALVATLTIGLVTDRFILSIGVAFILFVTPRPYLQRIVRARRRLLKDQLIIAINLIVNSAKAISSLEQVFESAALETPAPLGDELRRVVGEYNRGRTFEETLETMKRRLQLQDVVIFATTLITNQKHGGRLVDTLLQIKKSLVENQRLERKLEADTATGRLVVEILALVPAGFLLVSAYLNPSGTQLMFNTVVGQSILLAAVFLTYFGVRLGNKITNVEF